MICQKCNKDVDIENMTTDYICDDCFDKMMDDEDNDFSIYENQNHKCAICNESLTNWTIKDNKAICIKHLIDTDI